MKFLESILKNKEKNDIAVKDEVAKLLNVNPDAISAFEAAYRRQILDSGAVSDNFFEVNAKQAADRRERPVLENELDTLIERIVNELLEKTQVYEYDGISAKRYGFSGPENEKTDPVTLRDINRFPEEIRPQLSGNLTKVDIAGPQYITLLEEYRKYLKSPDSTEGKRHYRMFRQGLDLLDLDEITYQIIGMNPNSIGMWLPPLVDAVIEQSFFKVPATTVIKVPIPLLQLTRLDYTSLTPSTIAIVDRYCQRAFHLDEQKEYFVKTGTYSSKFDFRNAHVHGEKEVRELGEYLLFIHFQALQMASPLNNKQIYGVSTTNEWAVREYIPDKEGNPTIYKGMPLHTEYRIFVDFDRQKIIGVSPYWEPTVMKSRFAHEKDASSPHQVHDYIIYKAHEDELMKRYRANVGKVCENIRAMLKNIDLTGQWAIDVMQNGEDFWIIDMSLAQNSALSECVPKHLRRPQKENWLPEIIFPKEFEEDRLDKKPSDDWT